MGQSLVHRGKRSSQLAMYSFGRAYRIRKQGDFDRVYRARSFAADSVLIVNGSANGLAHTRLGLSVSRKVGGAVVRNRWKRLIREAFRLSRHELPPGLDLVVRPQKGAAPELEAILRSLPTLVSRVARRLSPPAEQGPTEGPKRSK